MDAVCYELRFLVSKVAGSPPNRHTCSTRVGGSVSWKRALRNKCFAGDLKPQPEVVDLASKKPQCSGHST